MPNWTAHNLADYERRRNRSTGLRATKPQSTQRHTLERPVSRKTARWLGIVPRFTVVYTVFAMRPCDCDGYHIKELQDMLVHAGILPEDGWRVLESCKVVTKKAESKEAERTEITIERL